MSANKKQGELLQFPAPKPVVLEEHEHCFIRGRSQYAGTARGRLVHSHTGGDRPHKHPDTGPASYTIDADEWARSTGLRGGGRKKFTQTPTGDQFPIVELEEWQRSFDIVVLASPEHLGGQGPGLALPLRLILANKLTVNSVTDGDSPGRRRSP
jgi:hypothetical protein